MSDEIISVIDSTSTNATNTMSDNKKVRYKMDCYVFHTFLLVAILLFIIVIICYHYVKRVKAKKYWYINKINFKKLVLKITSVIISMT